MSPTMSGHRKVSKTQIYGIFGRLKLSKIARIGIASQNISLRLVITHHVGIFRKSWKF